MVFDDGQMRAELLYLGNAHTHGDVFVWLPKERILFSGDACVNGPYNYMGDGNSLDWPKTLDAARALKPITICPGHGALANGSLIDDQKAYFITLQNQVRPLVKREASLEQLSRQTEAIRAKVLKNKKISRYVGNKFADQLKKFTGILPARHWGALM